MTILLDTYHLVWVLVGALTIIGAVYKLLSVRLRTFWQRDIEDKFEKERIFSKENLNKRFDDSTSSINKDVSVRFDLMNREVSHLHNSLTELKMMITTQNETLLAIQLGITDLKPRLESLEKRVDKIEDRRS